MQVRLEAQTDMCWLCERPQVCIFTLVHVWLLIWFEGQIDMCRWFRLMQKLLVPFEMRGYQGVYNLEKKVHSVQKLFLLVLYSVVYLTYLLISDKWSCY